LFAELVGEAEQVRALVHALGGIECGQSVDPSANFGESTVVKDVFAAVFDVFHVALGDGAPFFGVDGLGLGVKFFACQVFVHDGAKTEVVHGVGDVFARAGELGCAVTWRCQSTTFGNGLAHFGLGVTKVANQDLVVVLVLRVLAQEQILGLEVLMDDLVVMQLADGVRKIGNLSDSLDEFVVGELWLDDSVEGATLDELQLEVGVTTRDSAAISLHDTFDVRGTNEVVDADFVLECAQEHVQAMQTVLAGRGPVLADLDDDFFFVIALFVARVLYPELCTVELVGAFGRKRFDELYAFGVAVVLEVRVVVKPPLVFFHGVVGAQCEVARNPVHCFSQIVPKHAMNVEKKGDPEILRLRSGQAQAGVTM